MEQDEGRNEVISWSLMAFISSSTDEALMAFISSSTDEAFLSI